MPVLAGQTPAVDFSVAPPAGEFARVRMDAAELRRAAEQTGGRLLDFRERPPLAARSALRAAGSHRAAAALAAVERVARAGDVSGPSDRGMDTAETGGIV